MSDNHSAPAQITVTLAEAEWAVVLSALYEAPMPMKMTAPVVNKIQTSLAATKTMFQPQKQEGAL
jgi:hypothetical protein